MTNAQRTRFARAGYPADPRRFVSTATIIEARRLADEGYFNGPLWRPTPTGSRPTWIEAMIERALRWLRRRLGPQMKMVVDDKK